MFFLPWVNPFNNFHDIECFTVFVGSKNFFQNKKCTKCYYQNNPFFLSAAFSFPYMDSNEFPDFSKIIVKRVKILPLLIIFLGVHTTILTVPKSSNINQPVYPRKNVLIMIFHFQIVYSWICGVICVCNLTCNGTIHCVITLVFFYRSYF